MDWEWEQEEYCRRNCEFMSEFKTFNSSTKWCELYEQKLVRGPKNEKGNEILCCDPCFKEKWELKILEQSKK